MTIVIIKIKKKNGSNRIANRLRFFPPNKSNNSKFKKKKINLVSTFSFFEKKLEIISHSREGQFRNVSLNE